MNALEYVDCTKLDVCTSGEFLHPTANHSPKCNSQWAFMPFQNRPARVVWQLIKQCHACWSAAGQFRTPNIANLNIFKTHTNVAHIHLAFQYMPYQSYSVVYADM